MSRSLSLLPLLLAIGGILVPTATARAADGAFPTPATGVIDTGSRIIYQSDYFSRFNVITARDQLERIPGIGEVLQQGGGGRGFGNGGDQVLINGRRLAGKANDMASTLDRIQARQVERIEVIRGTVDDLDVRSQGLVVNVVLATALSTSYGSWEASASHYSDARLRPGAELNYSGNLGALTLLASLGMDPRHENERQRELFRQPSGLPYERQLEQNRSDSDEYTVTVNSAYALGNGDLLNLNLLHGREDERGQLASDRFDLVPDNAGFIGRTLFDDSERSRDWELGGDYEHIRSNGNVLTALFVLNQRQREETSEQRSAPAGGNGMLEQLQWENSRDFERIVRGTYRWNINPTQSLESGAELAFNSTERHIRLFEDTGGVLEERTLFNATSTVEEQRLETFATYTWNLNPALLLEASLDVEYSRLRQRGAAGRERDFLFWRPRLVARHDLDGGVQVRARIERTVAQLDFDDFSASFSNDDNRRDIINAGNPELVPERAWQYELTWEKRLANDLGLVSASVVHDAITDHQGRTMLLLRDAQGAVHAHSAPGNIGTARRTRLRFDGSLRLAWLGLERALLEGYVELTDSEATDAFTGEKRRIADTAPWEGSLSFRHDTRWHNLSYGVSTWQRGASEQFDLDYRQRVRIKPDLELFMELQPLPNLTLRLELEEALRAGSERERWQFMGNRGDGVVRRSEWRATQPLRELTLSVRGTF